MLRRILAGCVLLVMVLPLAAQNAKKKGAAKNDLPAVDADKLKPGVFVGKLLNPPGTDGEFGIEMEIQTLEPKANAGKGGKGGKGANAQARLSQQQLRLQRDIVAMQRKMAMGKLTPGDVARLQREQVNLTRLVAQAQPGGAASPYRLKSVKQRVDFHASPNVKVRLLEPAQQFTDKGEIKKYTKAELEQLRGKDRQLPGYEATLADLRGGQIVRVVQGRVAAAKAEDNPAEDAKAASNRVTLVVILGTPAEPVIGGKKKR